MEVGGRGKGGRGKRGREGEGMEEREREEKREGWEGERGRKGVSVCVHTRVHVCVSVFRASSLDVCGKTMAKTGCRS